MADIKPHMIYRGASIGEELAEALDELIRDRRIEPQLARKVMQNFDKAVAQVLAQHARARITNMKGHYKSCNKVEGVHNDAEGIFKLIVEDVKMKLDDKTEMTVERMVIRSFKPSSAL